MVYGILESVQFPKHNRFCLPTDHLTRNRHLNGITVSPLCPSLKKEHPTNHHATYLSTQPRQVVLDGTCDPFLLGWLQDAKGIF